MQMSNARKAIYIIVSILCSFALWFYVNSDASVDLSISEIPVEFLNSESALANKGLVLLDGDDALVDLVLTMPRDLVYGFNTEQVHLFANLNSVNSTGSQSIAYSIAYPPGINPNLISVKSPTVQTVSVRVGELFRKSDVEVRVKLVGNVADGYVAGRVQTSPASLDVWGNQSEVTQVSYAQVTLNISNATSTINEQLELSFFNENGEQIESSKIHSASNTIQVTMPVISATDVPLVVNFIEEPGIRIGSFDYSLNVSAVTLSGDANQIAALGEIVLGEVMLADIQEEQTFTYDIPVPEGLTNLSGVTKATLTISNRDVSTRNVTVTNFDYENFDDEDRRVEVVTSSLNVTLRGTKSLLDSLTSGDISVVADLTDVANASGTYTVPASIRVEGDPDLGATQSYQLTVRISPREEEPETQDGDGAEDETGSEADAGAATETETGDAEA